MKQPVAMESDRLYTYICIIGIFRIATEPPPILGPKEIDGLLVLTGKLLTDRLNAGLKALVSELDKEKWFKSNHPYICLICLIWMVIFQTRFGCHDVLILGRSPMNWRQRSDMTIAVDQDVKHQFRQTNETIFFNFHGNIFIICFLTIVDVAPFDRYKIGIWNA